MRRRKPDDFNNLHKHVHEHLMLRLWIFVVVAIALLAFVVYHITTDRTGLALPLAGIVMGVFVGILLSRIYKVFWDEDAEQVIFHLDIYGVIIFAVYILVDVYREQIVSYFVHGPVLTNTSLAFLAGIMVGRVIGLRGKITTVIKENV